MTGRSWEGAEMGRGGDDGHSHIVPILGSLHTRNLLGDSNL